MQIIIIVISIVSCHLSPISAVSPNAESGQKSSLPHREFLGSGSFLSMKFELLILGFHARIVVWMIFRWI